MGSLKNKKIKYGNISIFSLLLFFTICFFSTGNAEVIVDFGDSAGSNQYDITAFPGWSNVVISPEMSYANSGGYQGVLVSGSPADSLKSYIAVSSGELRDFVYGERIVVTWYNSSSVSVTFKPLISFEDTDYPVDSPGESLWLLGQSVTIAAGGTAKTIYDITDDESRTPSIPASEGTWSVINICLNSTEVTGVLCDKIEIVDSDLTPPLIPENLIVTNKTSKSISLSWSASTDSYDGLKKYNVYVNGVYRKYTSAEECILYNLESGTEYNIEVSAVDHSKNESEKSQSVTATTPFLTSDPDLIDPQNDFSYLGAFKLGSTDTAGFAFANGDIAFYPSGDPQNSDDFEGSLYIPANKNRLVAEVEIPIPVISEAKNESDLNTASVLQDFSNIKPENAGVGNLSKHPGLSYLPRQGSQIQDYLYTCFGDNYQVGGGRLNSFGASSLDLSNPSPAGGWFLGPEQNYSEPHYQTTISFIFSIPDAINGHRLVAGGSRYGNWHHGPTLVAYSPWNDQMQFPVNETELSFKPLLMYQNSTGSEYLEGFRDNDLWRGGSWLTTGEKSAVVISGLKAHCEFWYGYNSGESTGDYRIVPRVEETEGHGPRNSNYRPLLLFYKTADMLNVAADNMETFEPQPYAALNLQKYLFSSNNNDPGYSSKGNGPVAFDRANGLLYVMELRVFGMYDAEPIIHVFKVEGGGSISAPGTDPDPAPELETTTDTSSSDSGSCFISVLNI